MKKIVLILSVFLVAACISEIKPILKPKEVDIPNRIADQLKWLDQDLASKSVTPKEAKEAIPIRDKIKQIKEKYDRLQSAGPLTTKDSQAINRMLDQTSEMIFRLTLKREKPPSY